MPEHQHFYCDGDAGLALLTLLQEIEERAPRSIASTPTKASNERNKTRAHRLTPERIERRNGTP